MNIEGPIKFEALPCSQRLYDCTETIMAFLKGLVPYGAASSRTCKKGEPTLRKFRPSPYFAVLPFFNIFFSSLFLFPQGL